MKKLIILVIAALAVSCATQDRVVKLVSYNVGAFSKDKEDSTPEIAAFLQEIGAESVGLNEVDSCNTRHNVDQLAVLARTLGPQWNHQYARAMYYRKGAYGNGIVSKVKVLSGGRIALPKNGGSEARSCAYIETPDYVFAALHLDHVTEKARLEQLEAVTTSLKALYEAVRKPVFLAGDFNAEPGDAVITKAAQDWDILTPPELSFPADKPKICIDYIMLLKGTGTVEVLKAGVIDPGKGLSDHRPTYLEVKL